MSHQLCNTHNIVSWILLRFVIPLVWIDHHDLSEMIILPKTFSRSTYNLRSKSAFEIPIPFDILHTSMLRSNTVFEIILSLITIIDNRPSVWHNDALLT